MLTHFHTVYGCLHTTVTEVSSCDRNCRGLKVKNIYYLVFLEKVFYLCCACPTFIPEGLISLEDSLCEGFGYSLYFSGLLQKDAL